MCHNLSLCLSIYSISLSYLSAIIDLFEQAFTATGTLIVERFACTGQCKAYYLLSVVRHCLGS